MVCFITIIIEKLYRSTISIFFIFQLHLIIISFTTGKCLLYTDAAEDDRQAMLIAGKRALEQASTELATKTDVPSNDITATVSVEKLLEGKVTNRNGVLPPGAGGIPPRIPPHLMRVPLPRPAIVPVPPPIVARQANIPPRPAVVPVPVPNAAVRQANIPPPVQRGYREQPVHVGGVRHIAAPRFVPRDLPRQELGVHRGPVTIPAGPRTVPGLQLGRHNVPNAPPVVVAHPHIQAGRVNPDIIDLDATVAPTKRTRH